VYYDGGSDNLLHRLLMQIQNVISRPLWILFQKSLQEGAVPDDWKRANVTPIFKKGSRGLPENYRPVSPTIANAVSFLKPLLETA